MHLLRLVCRHFRSVIRSTSILSIVTSCKREYIIIIMKISQVLVYSSHKLPQIGATLASHLLYVVLNM